MVFKDDEDTELPYLYKHGEIYAQLGGFMREVYAQILPAAIAEMDIKENENILEFHSRDSYIAKNFLVPIAKGNGGKVFSIDSSSSMVCYARDRYSDDILTQLQKDNLWEKEISFDENAIHKVFMIGLYEDFRRNIMKSFEMTERNGPKLCTIFVSRNEPHFRFLEFLRTNEKWIQYVQRVAYPSVVRLTKEGVRKATGPIMVPDWVKMDWEGGDYIKCLENTVNSGGFAIESVASVSCSHSFNSKADCVDFLLSGTGMQAYGTENFIKKESQWEELKREFLDFLSNTDTMQKYHREGGKFVMEYELTTIVSRKVFPWLGKDPKNDEFDRKRLPLITTTA